jgi:NAD dependent epimerase/dehydratase family enzyme
LNAAKNHLYLSFMETILITGGSGLIGRNLIPKLIKNGYKVRVLSRSTKPIDGAEVFRWNVEDEFIDPEALKDLDHIIHLAGANVGEGRWTTHKKQLILDSRIKSAELLLKALEGKKLKSFISAAGASIYGTVTDSKIFKEEQALTSAKDDFLADVSIKWEQAADLFDPVAASVSNSEHQSFWLKRVLLAKW